MTTPDNCLTHLIDESKVAAVRRRMLDDLTAERLSQTFKAISDRTRIKIIYALLAGGELCVCDLSAAVGISASATSHQLRGLRDLKLVKYRREGQVIYYSLDDEHIVTLLSQGLDHVMEG